MDDSVAHFLDKTLSHAQIKDIPADSSFDFKNFVDTKVVPSAGEFKQFLEKGGGVNQGEEN